jgi:xanthine dehydrogenase molybdenum-binding subunit
MAEVGFRLDGREVVAAYDDGMTLLEVLREVLGVSTLKDGCAPQGFCGCCTVLVDGRPALACLKRPEQVAGLAVTTLDGLPEAQRQLLARAFVREGAIQCGYCTPGIVMRAASLLDRGKATDPTAVKRALAGHLCRCTGYLRVVDAVTAAGAAWRDGVELEDGPPRRMPTFAGGEAAAEAAPGRHRDGVGAAASRWQGEALALGHKPYVADMAVPGMLHAALVLSPEPRAVVQSIDPAPVLAMPGVVRVLTAADVPGERFVGLIVRDWPVLVAVGETTRCVGDVLAVVVADSRFHARRAAEAVRLEFEVLEPVTDPTAALAPDAPALHPGGNLLEACAFGRGDVEAALAGAAHVVDEVFTTQRIEHAFLEPEACLAMPEKDRLKVFSQGQGVHDDQRQIAAILGVDPSVVEVELVSNGGAFGGKEDLSVQGQAALAAHLLGTPVKLVLSRDESIRLHPKRHPLEMRYTVGCDGDGRLLAARVRIVGDTGAYASVGAKVLERAAGHCCGPYRVPAVDVEARTVYTNNPPSGAMRGFGVNQTAFAIEGILDRFAAKVGIDRWEIRWRNALEPGDRFATGQVMDSSCGIRATLEAVREVFYAHPTAGLACGVKNTGIGNGLADTGRVILRPAGGGRLEIVTGFTEMGQGLFTILRQVVAHETGLDPATMDVAARSEVAALCGMTTASRATALATMAAKRAAIELAVALEGGATVGDLAGREFLGEYICDFTVAADAGVEDPVTHLTFGWATQLVELDDEGRIARVVAAHDVGRAINPLGCAQQIEGAIHMGLGMALSEDLPCTGGRPDSTRLRDLGILHAADMPEVEVILVEVPDRVGGYGSKGVGEIGLVPTAAAVAAALAVRDGVWRTALPMQR